MRSDAMKITFGALLVFGVVFLYTREVPFLQNTLDFKSLFITATAAALLLGIVLGYFFSKDRSSVLERFQIFLAAIFLSILLMPLLLSLSNRALDFNDPVSQEVELLRVESFSGSRFGRLEETKEQSDGYRIYLLNDGEVMRLQSKTPLFADREKGDFIKVPIQRGLWGFRYVNWQ